MSTKKNILTTIPIAVFLVLATYYLLDRPIALFVKKVLMTRFEFFSSNIPDTLFFIVCAITGIAWAEYYYFRRIGVYNEHARFSMLVAISVPLAFMVKTIVKVMVGRIDTRFWVHYPRAKQFHWFHGYRNYTSFPSGHMAVFTAFLLAVARFYPKYRYVSYGLLVILAVALVVTDYHFLSDVIAGAYLGFITDQFIASSLEIPSRAESQCVVNK